jgi:hypothetical protein
MLAKYTVTQNGLSNGNVIAQPFSIEVHAMMYRSEEVPDDEGNPVVESDLTIVVCTKNGANNACDNDNIPNSNLYDLPLMSASKNSDLTATIEVDLTAAYGANWSKD